MRISVVGLGKAGLPLAAVIADKGFDVLGVDLDKNKVEKINKGINPLEEEPGLKRLISSNAGSHLKATSDPIKAAKSCNVHIIVVPLFIGKNKKPDFSMLKNALESLAKCLKRNDIVILETTVPVGTTENFVKKILEKGSGLKAGRDFYLAYSPERIMTGYSISRYVDFPKLIGGIDEKSTEKAYKVYSSFISTPVKVSNARTAELAKIAEGVYRDVNIALANELFMASEHYNVDFWEMRDAAKHEFCNILEPGNVGGHCIPIYPWFLINELDAPLAKAARELNDGMIHYYMKKIERLNGKKGKKVGIIGLSYREGVKEKAYSRSAALIDLLKKKGYDVYGIDPLYSKEEIKKEFGINHLENFNKMDVIILMNEEFGYKDKLKRIKNKVIDVKNVLIKQ
ncbi:nucleotide sugar dehydrogenase [Candidatus Woesearchaeota archaeon]|nr:nucleotide sugar dehydrogenase [Candidatus Woesearchaeota archaeon]